jgi:hypothetical protein
MDEDILAIGGFFFTTIVLGLGIPLVRAYVRRKELESSRPRLEPGVDDRLERIEHAIEAMAVEVERISEGQRFVTRLLSERSERAPERLSVGERT